MVYFVKNITQSILISQDSSNNLPVAFAKSKSCRFVFVHSFSLKVSQSTSQPYISKQSQSPLATLSCFIANKTRISNSIKKNSSSFIKQSINKSASPFWLSLNKYLIKFINRINSFALRNSCLFIAWFEASISNIKPKQWALKYLIDISSMNNTQNSWMIPSFSD